MKNRVTRLLALLLALLTVFALASCDLFDKDEEKATKEADEENTKAQTSEMQGIEKRLDDLERQYELTYVRLTYEERNEALEWLCTNVGASISGELSKGYCTEKNDGSAYIFEFKKSSDAKNAESSLNEVIKDYHFSPFYTPDTVTRKNNVVVFGNDILVDLITNPKSSSQNEPAQTTRPSYTEPSYTATTAYPSYSTEEPTTEAPYDESSMDLVMERLEALDKYGELDLFLGSYSDLDALRAELKSMGIEMKGDLINSCEIGRDTLNGYQNATVIEFQYIVDAQLVQSVLQERNNDPDGDEHILSRNVLFVGNAELLSIATP